jgi:putative phage-type endonuclease
MENTDSEFFPETDSNSTQSFESIQMIRIESIDEITIESTCPIYTESESDNGIDSEISSLEDDEDEDEDEEIITEEDFTELTTTAYDIMEEYIKQNILSLSSPKFYIGMIMHTTEVLYIDVLYSSNIDDDMIENYEELLFEEIKIFTEKTADVFLDICDIPRRSWVQQEHEMNNMTENDIFIMAEKIAVLQCMPQPEQKTTEWYTFRYNLITASNLWKVFGTKSQMNNLIYEKCKPLDASVHIRNNTYTEGAMHWGVKYEPVTVQIYEDMFDTKVGEFGCIPHSTYSYIGASPDGINIASDNKRFGRMLEIKNIVNRDITGIPKEEYWIQTQIQMETCDLDECDFVETRFKEYDTEDKFYIDTLPKYRGIILHFIERPPSVINEETQLSNIPYYVYMPLDIPLQKGDINKWIDIQKKNMYVDNRVLFSVKYWYLDEISCVFIPRNRMWFSNAVSHIQHVWDTIVKERIEGYEHRAGKKRQVTDRSMSIVSEDGIPMTVFSKVDNPVCLIKLDDDGNVL